MRGTAHPSKVVGERGETKFIDLEEKDYRDVIDGSKFYSIPVLTRLRNILDAELASRNVEKNRPGVEL